MEKSLQQVFDHLSCKTLTRVQKGSVQLRELLQQTHFHSYFWTSKQSMDATVKKVLTAIVRNPSSEPMRKVNTELLTLLKAIVDSITTHGLPFATLRRLVKNYILLLQEPYFTEENITLMAKTLTVLSEKHQLGFLNFYKDGGSAIQILCQHAMPFCVENHKANAAVHQLFISIIANCPLTAAVQLFPATKQSSTLVNQLYRFAISRLSTGEWSSCACEALRVLTAILQRYPCIGYEHVAERLPIVISLLKRKVKTIVNHRYTRETMIGFFRVTFEEPVGIQILLRVMKEYPGTRDDIQTLFRSIWSHPTTSRSQPLIEPASPRATLVIPLVPHVVFSDFSFALAGLLTFGFPESAGNPILATLESALDASSTSTIGVSEFSRMIQLLSCCWTFFSLKKYGERRLTHSFMAHLLNGCRSILLESQWHASLSMELAVFLLAPILGTTVKEEVPFTTRQLLVELLQPFMELVRASISDTSTPRSILKAAVSVILSSTDLITTTKSQTSFLRRTLTTLEWTETLLQTSNFRLLATYLSRHEISRSSSPFIGEAMSMPQAQIPQDLEMALLANPWLFVGENDFSDESYQSLVRALFTGVPEACSVPVPVASLNRVPRCMVVTCFAAALLKHAAFEIWSPAVAFQLIHRLSTALGMIECGAEALETHVSWYTTLLEAWGFGYPRERDHLSQHNKGATKLLESTDRCSSFKAWENCGRTIGSLFLVWKDFGSSKNSESSRLPIFEADIGRESAGLLVYHSMKSFHHRLFHNPPSSYEQLEVSAGIASGLVLLGCGLSGSVNSKLSNMIISQITALLNWIVYCALLSMDQYQLTEISRYAKLAFAALTWGKLCHTLPSPYLNTWKRVWVAMSEYPVKNKFRLDSQEKERIASGNVKFGQPFLGVTNRADNGSPSKRQRIEKEIPKEAITMDFEDDDFLEFGLQDVSMSRGDDSRLSTGPAMDEENNLLEAPKQRSAGLMKLSSQELDLPEPWSMSIDVTHNALDIVCLMSEAADPVHGFGEYSSIVSDLLKEAPSLCWGNNEKFFAFVVALWGLNLVRLEHTDSKGNLGDVHTRYTTEFLGISHHIRAHLRKLLGQGASDASQPSPISASAQPPADFETFHPLRLITKILELVHRQSCQYQPGENIAKGLFFGYEEGVSLTDMQGGLVGPTWLQHEEADNSPAATAWSALLKDMWSVATLAPEDHFQTSLLLLSTTIDLCVKGLDDNTSFALSLAEVLLQSTNSEVLDVSLKSCTSILSSLEEPFSNLLPNINLLELSDKVANHECYLGEVTSWAEKFAWKVPLPGGISARFPHILSIIECDGQPRLTIRPFALWSIKRCLAILDYLCQHGPPSSPIQGYALVEIAMLLARTRILRREWSGDISRALASLEVVAEATLIRHESLLRADPTWAFVCVFAYCIRSIPLRFLPHIPNIMEKEIWGELFRSSSIQGAVMCDVLRLNLVRNQGDPEDTLVGQDFVEAAQIVTGKDTNSSLLQLCKVLHWDPKSETKKLVAQTAPLYSIFCRQPEGSTITVASEFDRGLWHSYLKAIGQFINDAGIRADAKSYLKSIDWNCCAAFGTLGSIMVESTLCWTPSLHTLILDGKTFLNIGHTEMQNAHELLLAHAEKHPARAVGGIAFCIRTLGVFCWAAPNTAKLSQSLRAIFELDAAPPGVYSGALSCLLELLRILGNAQDSKNSNGGSSTLPHDKMLAGVIEFGRHLVPITSSISHRISTFRLGVQRGTALEACYLDIVGKFIDFAALVMGLRTVSARTSVEGSPVSPWYHWVLWPVCWRIVHFFSPLLLTNITQHPAFTLPSWKVVDNFRKQLVRRMERWALRGLPCHSLTRMAPMVEWSHAASHLMRTTVGIGSLPSLVSAEEPDTAIKVSIARSLHSLFQFGKQGYLYMAISWLAETADGDINQHSPQWKQWSVSAAVALCELLVRQLGGPDIRLTQYYEMLLTTSLLKAADLSSPSGNLARRCLLLCYEKGVVKARGSPYILAPSLVSSFPHGRPQVCYSLPFRAKVSRESREGIDISDTFFCPEDDTADVALSGMGEDQPVAAVGSAPSLGFAPGTTLAAGRAAFVTDKPSYDICHPACPLGPAEFSQSGLESILQLASASTYQSGGGSDASHFFHKNFTRICQEAADRLGPMPPGTAIGNSDSVTAMSLAILTSVSFALESDNDTLEWIQQWKPFLQAIGNDLVGYYVLQRLPSRGLFELENRFMVVLKEAEEEDKDVTSPMEASWLSLPSLQLESWTVGKDYASWAANILILLIKDFFGEHPFRKLIPIIEKWPQVAQQLLPAVFAAVLEKDLKMSWSSPGTFQIEELSEEKLSKPLGWEAEVGVVATALPLPDYLEAELSAIASKLSENSPVTKNKPLFKMPDEVPVFSVLPVHMQLARCMNSVLRTTLQEKHSSARKQACKIIVHSLSYLRQVRRDIFLSLSSRTSPPLHSVLPDATSCTIIPHAVRLVVPVDYSLVSSVCELLRLPGTARLYNDLREMAKGLLPLQYNPRPAVAASSIEGKQLHLGFTHDCGFVSLSSAPLESTDPGPGGPSALPGLSEWSEFSAYFSSSEAWREPVRALSLGGVSLARRANEAHPSPTSALAALDWEWREPSILEFQGRDPTDALPSLLHLSLSYKAFNYSTGHSESLRAAASTAIDEAIEPLSLTSPSRIQRFISHMKIIQSIRGDSIQAGKNSHPQTGNQGLALTEGPLVGVVERIASLHAELRSSRSPVSHEEVAITLLRLLRKEALFDVVGEIASSLPKSPPVIVEFARILWARGDQDKALNMIGPLSNGCSTLQFSTRLRAFRFLGSWLTSAGPRSASNVLSGEERPSVQTSIKKIVTSGKQRCPNWVVKKENVTQLIQEENTGALACLWEAAYGQTPSVVGSPVVSERRKSHRAIGDFCHAAIIAAKETRNGDEENIRASIMSERRRKAKLLGDAVRPSLGGQRGRRASFSPSASDAGQNLGFLYTDKGRTAAKRYFIELKKTLKEDESRDERSQLLESNYLALAVHNYATYLALLPDAERNTREEGSTVEISYRLLSLWFKNTSNAVVNKIMAAAAPSLSPSKCLPLIPQLVSRLSYEDALERPIRYGADEQSIQELLSKTIKDSEVNSAALDALVEPQSLHVSFQAVLAELLCRTGEAFPFHVLPHLRTLANLDKVDDGREVDFAKKKAADVILHRLARGPAGKAVAGIELLYSAYMTIANLELPKSHRGKTVSMKSLRIANSRTKIHALFSGELAPSAVRAQNEPDDAIGAIASGSRYFPILTSGSAALAPVTVLEGGAATLAPSVYMLRFDEHMSVAASGIKMPKIVKAYGSDGRVYRQMVKGDEDMRQDAVMQQYFSVVNSLLQLSPRTRKPGIAIRTYKVVPMSPTCGLLEFVGRTSVLAKYLTAGRQAAHTRFREMDWPNTKCWKLMQSAKAEGFDAKKRTLQLVMKNFKPVFHYFFLEMFCDPETWHLRQTIYARSVAASSMAGYIVGIGDRHTQNIMIDTATAEVVHVDFGIAFEQGKLLEAPELIPFRLTRDIVAGMGIGGLSGEFQATSESVLDVIRRHQSSLLSVLEIILHDPLYRWVLTPAQTQRLQSAAEGQEEAAPPLPAGSHDLPPPLPRSLSANHAGSVVSPDISTDALRTLLKCKAKMKGMEDSYQPLSVKAQVHRLVEQAQSIDNLACAFEGWQAWV